MHKPLLLIIGAGCLVSCHKKDDAPSNDWSWFGTRTGAVYNYVLINANQTMAGVDSDSLHVAISAAFIDSNNHQVGAVRNLRVNDKDITPGTDYTYNYNYPAGNGPGDVPGFGSDVKVNIQGDDAADTVSSQVYLPKRLLRFTSFPQIIHKPLGYPLTWEPDQANTWGNVLIQLFYFRDMSLRDDSSLPYTIETVNITVPDNGNYTLTETDLASFPKNAYLGITIARGTQTQAILPLSKKRVYYFTSASLSTPAIRVVP